MKLYATVTSERASKGQGGNEYLDITINEEKGASLARIIVKDGLLMFALMREDWLISQYKEKGQHFSMSAQRDVNKKGEKQKGEWCTVCERDTPHTGNRQCKVCRT